jgi:hypothetical protein
MQASSHSKTRALPLAETSRLFYECNTQAPTRSQMPFTWKSFVNLLCFQAQELQYRQPFSTPSPRLLVEPNTEILQKKRFIPKLTAFGSKSKGGFLRISSSAFFIN